MHEWTETFERFWGQQLNRIKERAEAKMNRARPDLKSKEEA